MRYLFLCIFLFLGELSVSAQHMLSRPFPFFNRLSSNEIFNIHQDREGYFWLGTTNGLARYDGYQLNTFRSDYKNQNLLLNNSIMTINDNRLYVWIGTWGGLNLYDKQTCRIIPFHDERLRSNPIITIAVSEDETVWVGTDNRIYRCDSVANIVKEYDISSSSGYSISSIYIRRSNFG